MKDIFSCIAFDKLYVINEENCDIVFCLKMMETRENKGGIFLLWK